MSMSIRPRIRWTAFLSVLVLVVSGAFAGLTSPAAQATPGVDDYPANLRNAAKDSVIDPWRFYNRECTSFVAWRLNNDNGFAFTNFMGGGQFGNAENWGANARRLGYRVDSTPAAGAVAWWSSNHVAWVQSVNSNGTVTIEEYNFPENGVLTGKYRRRTIAASEPSGYIHFKDLAGTGDGSVISNAGSVYVMAGGAPIYVSSWDAIGGPRSAQPVGDAEFRALRQQPVDGTFVADQDGSVYRFAGGAPIYVSSFDNVGGTGGAPITHVDRAALERHEPSGPWSHTNQYPTDGTFVADQDGSVYRFAGGAPLYVSSFDNVGGTGGAPITHVDKAALERHDAGGAFSHVLRQPADGTFVADQDGSVYRFAGGAPIYVSSFDNVGGTGGAPVTHVDKAALERHDKTGAYSHVNLRPADGTFVADQDGSVYRFAGGAPLYVSSFDNVGGTGGAPVTHVDKAALERHDKAGAYSHVLLQPRKGTRLRGGSRSYEVRGGAAYPVPERTDGVVVDPMAVKNAGGKGAWSHLRRSAFTVTATSASSASKLAIDLGPDVSKASYQAQVQKRTGSRWVPVRTVSLRGTAHRATADLPAGTYRVVVAKQAGVRGAVSSTVRLTR